MDEHDRSFEVLDKFEGSLRDYAEVLGAVSELMAKLAHGVKPDEADVSRIRGSLREHLLGIANLRIALTALRRQLGR